MLSVDFSWSKSCTWVVFQSEIRGLPLLAEYVVDPRFWKLRSHRKITFRAGGSLFILVCTQRFLTVIYRLWWYWASIRDFSWVVLVIPMLILFNDIMKKELVSIVSVVVTSYITVLLLNNQLKYHYEVIFSRVWPCKWSKLFKKYDFSVIVVCPCVWSIYEDCYLLENSRKFSLLNKRNRL